MTHKLKYSLFSAFHHTFDEDENLRFLVGVDVREIKLLDRFLGAHLIRYRLQNPSFKKQISAEYIDLEPLPPISMGQGAQFIQYTGKDDTIKPGFYYKYVLSITVALSDQTEQYDHLKKTGFRTSLKSKTRIINYESPIINVEETNNIGLSSFDDVGFKRVYKSEAAVLGETRINTRKVTKEKLSEQNFLTIGINTVKDSIKLEFLAGYLFDDVSSEVWEPLTEEVLEGIAEPVLARISGPAPYINKYFIVMQG